MPLLITNLQSQSVRQAGKILNSREGERLTLHQSQYRRRGAAVNKAPGEQNSLMEQLPMPNRKLALQLTQDSVASNIKNTISACIEVNNYIAALLRDTRDLQAARQTPELCLHLVPERLFLCSRL